MSSSNCNLEAFLATWNQGAYISALPGILRKDIGNLERSSPSRSDPHTLPGVSCPLVLLSYQAWRTMASRAAPSGIALDIRRKLDASYDIDGELNARLWIEDVTGILMDDPPAEVESLEQLNEWRINHRELGSRQFARVLKDGIFLCKLVNTLEPGTIKKIHEEKLSRFKMQENIFNFLKAAKTWGCTEQDLFQTVDLYEERNMNQVLNGIYAVARKVQDRISDDKFPTLGPKEAKYNPRDFTEEQLNRGKHVCALRF